MKQTKPFSADMVFESHTVYVATQSVYDIYPSEDREEIYAWWTFVNSGNVPLRAAFVLRGLTDVTIDLGGATLLLHGRILPFAVFDCKNITFRNFSIDYDRPFYTQGTVLASEEGSVTLRIPERFGYRIEGHDFIACGETWEHRLVSGDMLFRCFDAETGRLSSHSDTILALIGDEIHPRENPPLPIHHLYAHDEGNRCVRLTHLPANFRPRVGEILTMTHEDRRKTGFLLERCKDTVLQHVRLRHIGAMGITACLCHNISLDDFSMYPDESTPDRIVTVNADGFHTFHCSGLMKVENCRFENLLDDAVNIHGNYLRCLGPAEGAMLTVDNVAASLRAMPYFLPGDAFVIYKGSTREVRCRGTVLQAKYLPGQYRRLQLTLKEAPDTLIEAGDCLENLRMPEIEIRGCIVRCLGGFRLSSGKRTLVEHCTFETPYVAIQFTGDMNYWYENTGVDDVTIRHCTFRGGHTPIVTNCEFTPTEKAPFYHRHISITDNTFIAPQVAAVQLSDVDGVTYCRNTVTDVPAGTPPVRLARCNHVTVE